MVKPPRKVIRHWAEMIRTTAALMTLMAQGTLIYLYVSSK